uniref:Uncharacterized protein n=1 Tax=Rhizophora mucronata TaxID=61149 RepID=A0A2P2N238_RHIMU
MIFERKFWFLNFCSLYNINRTLMKDHFNILNET